MTYTIAQIDDAISGKWASRPGEAGWSRPLAMINTAAAAWIRQRPEDQHTVVLRAGLLDLEDDGCLKPHDGVWPED